LKFGVSNEFTHGRLLERALRGAIPSNGLSVASLRLQRPTGLTLQYGDVPALSVEFQLSGPEVGSGRGQMLAPKFHRPFRLVILGEDGFPYVEEFERIRKYQDGVYVYVTTTAFPRTSSVLRFRLEQHNDRLGPWRTVAEFTRRNPARAKEKEWFPESYPVMRTSHGLSFVLGEVTVGQNHSNAWENFWQNRVTIPLQIAQDGVLLTNWGLHELRAEDSSGNSLFLGTEKSVENGWIVHRAFRSVDPGKEWRLRAGIAPDSAYAATNLFTLRVPIPLGAPFTTNVGGYPLKVGFVNVDMLSVDLLTKAPELRLAFVGARDEQGRDLDAHSGSWGQFGFWKALSLPALSSLTPPPAATITATIAISPNVPVEFTIKPRLIDSSHPSRR
jgi:hypothetical protein